MSFATVYAGAPRTARATLIERQLADWCAPAIRLRQRLPPTDL